MISDCFRIAEYVIMPDHIHMIVCLENSKLSLSQIIGSIKTRSSRLIHKMGYEEFKWQRSFYDEIIRTRNEYDRVKEYILDNVIK